MVGAINHSSYKFWRNIEKTVWEILFPDEIRGIDYAYEIDTTLQGEDDTWQEQR